ncbi:putative ATP-dependent acetyltransferase [Escherichia coli]|uniref:Putative ATP-dependent acetyltransferase n=1 Tax=Escherichia coli TaxID=562 RepID=A0A2X3K480_ECOLX|nr:putative ATP-dependent acetyltransferase [Escherichia coli]
MHRDALLASDEQADWLVVDEAGSHTCAVVASTGIAFSSNVVNHYGAGLRRHRTWFFAEILRSLSAFTPFLNCNSRSAGHRDARWKKWLVRPLVFDDENFTHTPQGNIVISAFEQTLWRSEPETPLKVYQLLSGAHYRTSPLDLRRMMDAPGQHFLQAGWRKRDCRSAVAGG